MNASEEYTKNSLSTQDRCKLVVMLYDGATKFLKIAKQKLHEEDYALKGVYIGKAQDIIGELNNSLDMDEGGQIAQDLRSLYNFLHGHLNTANFERSALKIDECISILEELRQAWEQVAGTMDASSIDYGRLTGYQA